MMASDDARDDLDYEIVKKRKSNGVVRKSKQSDCLDKPHRKSKKRQNKEMDSGHGLESDILDRGALSTFKIGKKLRLDTSEGPRLEELDTTSKEYVRDIEPTLNKYFRDSRSVASFKVNRAFLVYNRPLWTSYCARRTELRNDSSTRDLVSDHYGYLLVDEVEGRRLAELGLEKGNCSICHLGQASEGVVLSQYPDFVCPSVGLPPSGWLLVVKYMRGRVYTLVESNDQLDPQPNYDCHVSSSASFDLGTTSVSAAHYGSAVYLYEYSQDFDLLDKPRHVMPYALVQFVFSGVCSARSVVTSVPRTVQPVSDGVSARSTVPKSAPVVLKRAIRPAQSLDMMQLDGSRVVATAQLAISPDFGAISVDLVTKEKEYFSPLTCRDDILHLTELLPVEIVRRDIESGGVHVVRHVRVVAPRSDARSLLQRVLAVLKERRMAGVVPLAGSLDQLILMPDCDSALKLGLRPSESLDQVYLHGILIGTPEEEDSELHRVLLQGMDPVELSGSVLSQNHAEQARIQNERLLQQVRKKNPAFRNKPLPRQNLTYKPLDFTVESLNDSFGSVGDLETLDEHVPVDSQVDSPQEEVPLKMVIEMEESPASPSPQRETFEDPPASPEAAPVVSKLKSLPLLKKPASQGSLRSLGELPGPPTDPRIGQALSAISAPRAAPVEPENKDDSNYLSLTSASEPSDLDDDDLASISKCKQALNVKQKRRTSSSRTSNRSKPHQHRREEKKERKHASVKPPSTAVPAAAALPVASTSAITAKEKLLQDKLSYLQKLMISKPPASTSKEVKPTKQPSPEKEVAAVPVELDSPLEELELTIPREEEQAGPSGTRNGLDETASSSSKSTTDNEDPLAMYKHYFGIRKAAAAEAETDDKLADDTAEKIESLESAHEQLDALFNRLIPTSTCKEICLEPPASPDPEEEPPAPLVWGITCHPPQIDPFERHPFSTAYPGHVIQSRQWRQAREERLQAETAALPVSVPPLIPPPAPPSRYIPASVLPKPESLPQMSPTKDVDLRYSRPQHPYARRAVPESSELSDVPRLPPPEEIMKQSEDKVKDRDSHCDRLPAPEKVSPKKTPPQSIPSSSSSSRDSPRHLSIYHDKNPWRSRDHPSHSREHRSSSPRHRRSPSPRRRGRESPRRKRANSPQRARNSMVDGFLNLAKVNIPQARDSQDNINMAIRQVRLTSGIQQQQQQQQQHFQHQRLMQQQQQQQYVVPQQSMFNQQLIFETQSFVGPQFNNGPQDQRQFQSPDANRESVFGFFDYHRIRRL